MNLIPRYFLGDAFDDFFRPSLSANGLMKTDIYEEDGSTIMKIDLPGFKKEDINIELTNGLLTVSAKQESEDEENSKDYLRKERFASQCQRTFNVGNINESDISASYNNGTLEIILQKSNFNNDNKKLIEIK